MGDGGEELASERSCVGMEIGKVMVGEGHNYIWPQYGEFSTNIGGETTLRSRGICDAKRRTRRVSRVTGAESGAKGVRDDPDGVLECADGRQM